jgi:8-oxo-dGTP pyrophosphatase MutT (NUDIX family)
VAFIHDAATGVNQLPKGRKNIGEDMHAAALRETREETGLRVRPLPLRIMTRATPTEAMLGGFADDEQVQEPAAGGDEEGDWADVDQDVPTGAAGVTDWVQSCEPVGITTHRCETTLAFKVIFWYAAQADSTEAPDLDLREEWETQYELRWVDARQAAGLMTFAADAEAIDKALADVRRSGYDV